MGNSPSHPPSYHNPHYQQQYHHQQQRQQLTGPETNDNGQAPPPTYPYPYHTPSPYPGPPPGHYQLPPGYPNGGPYSSSGWTPPQPQDARHPTHPGGSNSGYPGAHPWYAYSQTQGGTAYPYQWYPPLPSPTPTPVEIQHTKTVRNHVNVKRTSVRLERGVGGLGKHVVCFKFDATVAGRAGVFFLAKEGESCSYTAAYPEAASPVIVPFDKGVNQEFRQPTEAAVDLSLLPKAQLGQVNKGEGGDVYPLVICMVTTREGLVTDNLSSSSPAPRSADSASMPAWHGLSGEPLNPSVQAQITFAVLVVNGPKGRTPEPILSASAQRNGASPVQQRGGGKFLGKDKGMGIEKGKGKAEKVPESDPKDEGGEEEVSYEVKVVSQRFWIDGTEYDLQEIYGCADSAVSSKKGMTAEGEEEGVQPGSGPAGSSGEGSKVDSLVDEAVDDGDSGADCVICLSAPRNTTCLPCRHMCMCSDCTKLLRYQTNKCPICRETVTEFLEIKIGSMVPSIPSRQPASAAGAEPSLPSPLLSPLAVAAAASVAAAAAAAEEHTSVRHDAPPHFCTPCEPETAVIQPTHVFEDAGSPPSLSDIGLGTPQRLQSTGESGQPTAQPQPQHQLAPEPLPSALDRLSLRHSSEPAAQSQYNRLGNSESQHPSQATPSFLVSDSSPESTRGQLPNGDTAAAARASGAAPSSSSSSGVGSAPPPHQVAAVSLAQPVLGADGGGRTDGPSGVVLQPPGHHPQAPPPALAQAAVGSASFLLHG